MNRNNKVIMLFAIFNAQCAEQTPKFEILSNDDAIERFGEVETFDTLVKIREDISKVSEMFCSRLPSIKKITYKFQSK